MIVSFEGKKFFLMFSLIKSISEAELTFLIAFCTHYLILQWKFH